MKRNLDFYTHTHTHTHKSRLGISIFGVSLVCELVARWVMDLIYHGNKAVTWPFLCQHLSLVQHHYTALAGP